IDFDDVMTVNSRPSRDRQRFPVKGRLTLESGHSETVIVRHPHGVMKITYYLLIYHQRSGMVSVPFKG
ncbi:MAG TPA: hypothetical protein VIJ25_20555, partial [Methylococcales bacterium]